jgi:hypothetical protein
MNHYFPEDSGHRAARSRAIRATGRRPTWAREPVVHGGNLYGPQEAGQPGQPRCSKVFFQP